MLAHGRQVGRGSVLARSGLVLAMLGAAMPVANARDLHVDVARGDDATGDGSVAAPWRTVSHALESDAYGDDIRIAPGRYDETTGETWAHGVDMCVSMRGDPGGGTVLATTGPGVLLQVSFGHCPGQIVEHLTLVGPGGRRTSVGLDLLPSWEDDAIEPLTVLRNRIVGFGSGIRFSMETYYYGCCNLVQNLYGGVTIDGNVFDGVRIGISYYLSLIYDAGLPLMVGLNQGREITNNTFLDNEIGISTTASCASAGGCSPPLEQLDRIWNNTFSGCGQALLLVGRADQTASSVRPEVMNNIFDSGGDVAVVLDGDQADLARLGGNDFWAYPAGLLKDHTRGTLRTIAEVNSFRRSSGDNLSAEPRLADRASGDVHLDAGSPCIDRGTDGGAPSRDFEADPRPLDGDGDGVARTDVGADEAGSCSDPPLADAGVPIAVCAGEPALLDGSGSVPCGAAGLEYRWLEDATVLCGWSPDPTCSVSPAATTVYTLEVACADVEAACPRSDSAPVVVEVRPDVTPPDAGNTLRAVRLDPTSVAVSWVSLADALSYNLYRATVKGPWPPLPLEPGLATATALLPDVAWPPRHYLYRVTGESCSGREGP